MTMVGERAGTGYGTALMRLTFELEIVAAGAGEEPSDLYGPDVVAAPSAALGTLVRLGQRVVPDPYLIVGWKGTKVRRLGMNSPLEIVLQVANEAAAPLIAALAGAVTAGALRKKLLAEAAMSAAQARLLDAQRLDLERKSAIKADVQVRRAVGSGRRGGAIPRKKELRTAENLQQWIEATTEALEQLGLQGDFGPGDSINVAVLPEALEDLAKARRHLQGLVQLVVLTDDED